MQVWRHAKNSGQSALLQAALAYLRTRRAVSPALSAQLLVDALSRGWREHVQTRMPTARVIWPASAGIAGYSGLTDTGDGLALIFEGGPKTTGHWEDTWVKVTVVPYF